MPLSSRVHLDQEVYLNPLGTYISIKSELVVLCKKSFEARLVRSRIGAFITGILIKDWVYVSGENKSLRRKKRHRDHGYGFFLKGYRNININQLATGS